MEGSVSNSNDCYVKSDIIQALQTTQLQRMELELPSSPEITSQLLPEHLGVGRRVSQAILTVKNINNLLYYSQTLDSCSIGMP